MDNLSIFFKYFGKHVPLNTPIAYRLLVFLGDKFKIPKCFFQLFYIFIISDKRIQSNIH